VAAWFTDCRHKVEPVTSGTRVILQYDLTLESDASCEKFTLLSDVKQARKDANSSSSGASAFNVSALIRLCTQVDAFLSADVNVGKRVGLLLKHEYSRVSLRREFLKGVDRALFDTLGDTNDVRLERILLSLFSFHDDDGYNKPVVVAGSFVENSASVKSELGV
jgi:hypothetical protein